MSEESHSWDGTERTSKAWSPAKQDLSSSKFAFIANRTGSFKTIGSPEAIDSMQAVTNQLTT
jgi:hypothetical protein